MRRLLVAGAAAVIGAAALTAVPSTAGATSRGPSRTYSVLYKTGASLSDAHAAVQKAGGRITQENTAVGLATVVSENTKFFDAVRQQSALFGAVGDRAIGRAPKDQKASRSDIEAAGAHEGGSDHGHPRGVKGTDPLTVDQWDMRMIRADQAHRVNAGSKRVLVGVIDTGIDGTHPDIAPNFNAELSRNFTTDIPFDPNGNELDGPCEHPSCKDPANEDDDGHGTHVAGTIASPVNGIGIAGVAPNVTLVNIRAGQDSGFFFLQPTIDALTYAGDIGVDVVNMSFYTDPWLYNCPNNPADSPDAQLEQRTVIEATNRALNYAHRRNVTLVAAAGNEFTDLGNPTFDDTSPDYPLDTAYARTVDNSCLDMPSEGNHVLNVSAVGPSTRKSYYSNYGTEQITIAAPGGDRNDLPGTPDYRVRSKTVILAPYPYNAAVAQGAVDPVTGDVLLPFAVKDCTAGPCSYYQYLQGTSMASPHAVGVAALIVSRFGERDERHKGGLTLDPKETEKILNRTAAKHACPDPRTYHYTDIFGASDPSIFDATCLGSATFNGFYGHGIVDALAAVRADRDDGDNDHHDGGHSH